MPVKKGGAGKSEHYNPENGKFVPSGKENKYYTSPESSNLIKKGFTPEEIRAKVSNHQSPSTPNLGEYAQEGQKAGKEFGLEFDNLPHFDTKMELYVWLDEIKEKEPEMAHELEQALEENPDLIEELVG